jgi:hypothetical protein
VKPRTLSLPLERAGERLQQAAAALDDAAHILETLSEEPGERLALAAEVAAAQARLAEALAAAIHAAPDVALDRLLGALAAGGGPAARSDPRH